MSGLVWYAAYGSNLLAARFHAYLTGGPVPHRPKPSIQAGARDSTPPLDDRPWQLPHELFFAGSSPGWGGGAVAFLDPRPLAAAHSYGRATAARLWLITTQQFEDVFRQENGIGIPGSSAHPGSGPGPRIDRGDGPLFDLAAIAPGGHLDAGPRWYGRVLHLGPGPDGHPVATFTGPDPHRHQRGPADLTYLRTVGLGLIESWDLSPAQATDHLLGCDGNRDAVDPQRLKRDLERWSGSS